MITASRDDDESALRRIRLPVIVIASADSGINAVAGLACPLMGVDGCAGVLLAHGAGGGAYHRTLVALERRLELPVHRIEFPYRREGRRMPDRAPKLIDAVRYEAEAFAVRLGVETDALVLGGRSMGGRMCSMAVAEGLEAAGLMLLSYPLHPPGRPDRMRVGHFGAVSVPVLFVSGDRDPFGSPVEFSAEITAIAGPVTSVWLEGQRHDPGPEADDEITAAVRSFLRLERPTGDSESDQPTC